MVLFHFSCVILLQHLFTIIFIYLIYDHYLRYLCLYSLTFRLLKRIILANIKSGQLKRDGTYQIERVATYRKEIIMRIVKAVIPIAVKLIIAALLWNVALYGFGEVLHVIPSELIKVAIGIVIGLMFFSSDMWRLVPALGRYLYIRHYCPGSKWEVLNNHEGWQLVSNSYITHEFKSRVFFLDPISGEISFMPLSQFVFKKRLLPSQLSYIVEICCDSDLHHYGVISASTGRTAWYCISPDWRATCPEKESPDRNGFLLHLIDQYGGSIAVRSYRWAGEELYKRILTACRDYDRACMFHKDQPQAEILS